MWFSEAMLEDRGGWQSKKPEEILGNCSEEEQAQLQGTI